MSQASGQAAPVKKLLMVDEFWRIGELHVLESSLIKVPGVPNARYLAHKGLVFVFSYLVQLVRQSGFSLPQDSEAVSALVQSAWIDPHVAVTQFHIEPVGFRIEQKGSTFYIHHDQLDARIPALFLNLKDAQRALADVLVGRSVASSGDFEYEGQWLEFIHPLNMELPSKPEFTVDACYKGGSSYFRAVGHLPGLAPFDRGLYDAVDVLVADWEAESYAIKRVAESEYSDIWSVVTSRLLPQPQATVDFDDPENEEENAQAIALVALYPELAELTKQSLYNHYAAFVTDDLHNCSVEAMRDDDFALYLLGTQVIEDQEEEQATNRGRYAWFSLKRGDAWQQACEFAASCERYADALSSLSWRVRDAMSLLHSKQSRQLEFDMLQPAIPGVIAIGYPMDPLGRSMREGRKFGVGIVTASQSKPLPTTEKTAVDTGRHTYDFITLGQDLQAALDQVSDEKVDALLSTIMGKS